MIRIKQERAWIRQFAASERPDIIISDNRYGLNAPGIFSVFITHQLRIKTPFGRPGDDFLQRICYRAINRFSLCWVPDLAGPGGLAGGLSHPDVLPAAPTRYIGVLSRMKKVESGPGCDLLVLLSGPEPQRTIFERQVLAALGAYPGSTILVRGLPGGSAAGSGNPADPGGSAGSRVSGSSGISLPANGRAYDHLDAGTLNTVMNGAGMILCRAGYSTIMDLFTLRKKAVLVPTPGQTEQEYLGALLSGRGSALCAKQGSFSLPGALAAAGRFPFVWGEANEEAKHAGTEAGTETAGGTGNTLQDEIQSLLEKIKVQDE